MPNTPEAPLAPTDRVSRLKGLRPSRPVTLVSGLAVVAVAVSAGVQASGAGSVEHRATTAAFAARNPTPTSGPDQRLADRGVDVAARSQERAALGDGQLLAADARQGELQRAEAEQAEREAERQAAAEADARAEAEAEARAEAERAEAEAAEKAATGWVLPTSGYTLTGRFGNSGSRWAHTHTGLDFAAKSGTPIKAAAAGRITSAGTAGAFGNRIVITHPDGTQTWYCHQSRFAKTSGAVAAGDLIGYVGTTGNSTGPHLHFEVHPGGRSAVDPGSWLRGKGVSP
ncbi:M23 family metallopeptidase [Embleya sp. NBC_00896]|uniref:M23 family metallopeptidase n=1 Tax=Embleya sp. NBC_00896 TaxID=2975961 RepID=UPI0038644E6D|nr:M23 family metallopeptidase [Embleya sp. NBC_00896]